MRIALIDDESSVRETIRTILQHYYPEVEIEEAKGVEEGLRLISDFKPGIVFLDVEMGDGTGFDLLTRVKEIQCPIVFVTAHDHYAVKAFKFSALDYILKPVDPQEIMKAVERAREFIDMNELKITTLLQNQSAKEPNKIVLSDSANIHLIKTEDIIVCQAVGNYTHFFLVNGRELVISKTLKHYDELLQDNHFVRVHQSYLINLHHFDHYDKRDGGGVVMKNGATIPVASRKRDHLLDVLKKFKA
ncbi:MAG: LytTR family DNA-binding domain-containing protein [Cyclobacteriaceae bacterium]